MTWEVNTRDGDEGTLFVVERIKFKLSAALRTSCAHIGGRCLCIPQFIRDVGGLFVL